METDDIMARYRDQLATTPNNSDGILPAELADQHGIGLKRARDIIRALLEAGQVERTARYVVRINGTRQRVVGYRLVSND